jgi:hypothetical protein
MSTTMLNLYMIFGGTNWGGIAHPGVYTSAFRLRLYLMPSLIKSFRL